VKKLIFSKKIFKMYDMLQESQIREFLETKEGKELFLKIFFEVCKAEKKKEEVKCPACGKMGRYARGGGKYLVFWHWEEDEATGLKKRRWCYIGKVVGTGETLDKKPVFVILERKKIWDEDLETPPNAPQSI
jgi:hypothetical protein